MSTGTGTKPPTQKRTPAVVKLTTSVRGDWGAATVKRETLTLAEIDLAAVLGDVFERFAAIMGNGPTRDHDLDTVAQHLDALNRMVMGQAAARSYPDQFRLLGEVIP